MRELSTSEKVEKVIRDIAESHYYSVSDSHVTCNYCRASCGEDFDVGHPEKPPHYFLKKLIHEKDCTYEMSKYLTVENPYWNVSD